MGKRYKHLEQLDCFDLLKQKLPDMLDDFEEQMRWYEEEATDEDIGECGENLPRFLVEVYGGNNSLEEFIEEIAI